ncbi:MAG TPA: 3-methyl-2-oxobutanoate hydroxymethyltransferase, partial [Thermodesulfobacterium commune]|nr:3-methyl-2-oxobutanoate hydroxymethyltransferase [Thermodesulfobacterium commune]
GLFKRFRPKFVKAYFDVFGTFKKALEQYIK